MADKTNSYQDYQDAQSQLLNIQAQQQANLQEARLMEQSQVATNNVLNQAAQVAAQTVAMGNTTQPVTFNPTTSAVLQQYGLGQPRVVKNQTRNQSVTPQHVTINNNTSNITNNNVSVPANIGGPLQGRPVQINPDVQMGTFKTWLSNVFAQQNAESARRDREYERRSSSLTRDANKILKKLGEIGGNIGKALDPRRLTSSSVNTIKTLFAVLGFAKFAKNIKHIANRADKFFNWLGIKGRNGEVSEGDNIWDKLRKEIVRLLGGKAEGEGAEGVGLALRKLFFTKEGEDSTNGKGIFNLLLDRIKIELKNRFEAASAAAKAYKESSKSSSSGLKVVDNIVERFMGATESIFKSFVNMDSSHVLNKSMENTADESANSEVNGDMWNTKHIQTMASEKVRKEIDSKLSYKNKKAKFSYNEKGQLVTFGNTDGIDLKDININNVIDFGDTITKDSNLRFDPGQFIKNGSISIENGDLMGVYLASRDIAINLLRAYSKPKKFSESIKSALGRIKQLDRVFQESDIDKIPVHDDFISTLAPSILNKLETRRYKILVRERFKNINKDRETGGVVRNALSQAPETIGKKTQNTTRYTFVLLPSANDEDIGDDGLTHMLYSISKEDLRDIVSIYTKSDNPSDLKIQDNKFSKNFAKTAYNNTDAKIRDDEEINAAMAEFQNWFGVNNQENYQRDMENWNKEVEESRPKQSSDYIKNETVVGQVLSEAFKKGKEIYQKGVDKVTGFETTTEFINKLRPAILDKLREYDLPEENVERYADILLSQLALESAWGKKPSGKNNYGGIKAPTEIKDGVRVPTDPKHAKERITREVLDGGLDKYPHLRSKIVEEPWQEVDGWHYKIKDWFKSYDSLEDFVDDYVDMLNNNWSSAMSGDTKLNDEELVNHYASSLKKGKNGGAYYTADAEKYTNTLTKIYNTIKSARERVAKEQAEKQQNPENEGAGGDNDIKPNSIGEKSKSIYDYDQFYQYFNEVLADKYPNREISKSSIGNYWYNMEDSDLINLFTKEKSKELPKNTFDIKKAVTALRSNTGTVINNGKRAEQLGLKKGDSKDRYYIKSNGTHSVGQCGYYVRTAIGAGGINAPASGTNAAGYVNYLPKIGFIEISNNSAKKPGDISIEEATNKVIDGKVKNKDGHAAMWDGYNWISDFVQNNQHVHHPEEARGKLHRFRYAGPKINTEYLPPSSINGLSSNEPIPELKNNSNYNYSNTSVVYTDSDITEAKNNSNQNSQQGNNIAENQQNTAAPTKQQDESISNIVSDYLSEGLLTAINDFSDKLSQNEPIPQTRSRVNLIPSLDSITSRPISDFNDLSCNVSNQECSIPSIPSLSSITTPTSITPEPISEPVPSITQDIASISSVNNDGLGGDSDESNSDMKQLIGLLSKMLTIEANTSYNTAAVPDKIDILAQLIARQQSKPEETRTATNSMLSNKSGRNW